jgi:REP element-mobilizing transposase RayT
MSSPRPVLKGTTYLVTRRCSERRFFLRPSGAVNEVFLFLLAVAAGRFGIRVHAFCVLSNHFHLLLTDPKARLPAFMQFLNGLLARVVNLLIGHKEAFFASGQYSAVELATPEDVVREAVYVLANPVAAGLVRFGHLWPGPWSAPERVGGEPFRVKRPKRFFSEEGSFPAEASLQLTVPPGFPSAEAFRSRLVAALEEREAELGREHLSFLGEVKIRRQRPTDRPRRKEGRKTLNPRVAAADKQTRKALLERLLAFTRTYREAWLEWVEGKRKVLFPAGTYQMRVLHGAACAGAG